MMNLTKRKKIDEEVYINEKRLRRKDIYKI